MEQPHSRPRGEGNSREVWREVWVEVCCRGLRTPTLFKTKIARFTTLFKTGDTTF